MRTRFDVIVHGDAGLSPPAPEAAQQQTARLRAAAETALAEIADAEQRFNFYDPESWLSRINRDAAKRPVRVPPDVFELLQLSQRVFRDSGGAFDPAVASASTDATDLAVAAGQSNLAGTELPTFAQVRLSPASRRVQFLHPSLQLDLGGVAKGWAIDLAVEALIEAGVTSALVHGGTSSIRAIGQPPGETGWKINIGDQACVSLCDQALGISHTFSGGGSTKDATCHIINPADGDVLRLPRLAAALCSGVGAAAWTDAWSTALLLQHSAPFTWKQLLCL
ncbi:MAG: FAD:protein FMN transferase [Planctomycetes bacterium]|nr:FAD:protein FMN transferase [Planctomycetota bacterium]